MKKLIFLSLLSIIFLQISCSTEPDDKLELTIENGYYSKISSGEEELKYSIEFNYKVSGKTCYVGGYGIFWDEKWAGSVDWYTMKKLEPGQIYSINDTLNISSDDITVDPIISMQGYLEHDSESDIRLKAEYQLKVK